MPESFGLKDRINDKSALVGVIGLGYVGLPLALTCAERGFKVTGFDIDDRKTEILNSGNSYIEHVGSSRVADLVEAGVFEATADFKRLSQPDILLICLPTPLTTHREPDMSYIKENAQRIRESLREGQLVILESTTYPGTTDELLKKTLEGSGLKCGHQFFLAYSPEREDPGNKDYNTSSIPKVIGADDRVSAELARHFYQLIVSSTHLVSSAAAAEAAKLTENIFRSVNIALVNELKIIFRKMGVDIWEVLDAAETKPFGFMRFDPGPGWGGHCIPIDPFYLTWKARELGLSTKFIELAGEVNITMPQWIISRMQYHLNNDGKSVKGSKILLVGLSYKRDVDDTRESPALEIMDILEDLGAEVAFHDPHVSVLPQTRRHPERAGRRSVTLDKSTVASFDAVLIVTDHSNVDYELLANHAKMLLDSRGVYHRKYPHLKDKVIKV